MTEIRKLAFDHVEALDEALTLAGVLEELQRAGNTFGYENFCISGLPRPNEKVDPYILLDGWPVEWMKIYKDSDYIHADPVIRRVKSASMPFMWEEAYLQGYSRKGQIMIGDAAQFGLREGFSVPVYTTHGFQAIVTYGARKMSLTSEQKAALHLISIYAHSKLRSFLPGADEGIDQESQKLTPREIECLKWAAAGKTTWETSVILAISQRTVEQYIFTATRKLGSVNRTQAVAEALRQRLL